MSASLRDAEAYGAVVFVGTPAGLEIGVDYTKWKPRTDSEVWVMSSMRPGAHFIYWSQDEKDVDFLLNGEFCYLSKQEVVVYRWSKRYFLREYDEDELERFREGHENLSLLSHAGVYPPAYVQPWLDVSYAVSRVAIYLFQGQDLLPKHNLDEYADQAEARFDELPGRSLGGRKYSDIPNRLKRKELGIDRTNMNEETSRAISTAGMDRSADLELLLRSYDESRRAATVTPFAQEEFRALTSQLNLPENQCLLLAELQMAFVTFLLGADLMSQAQWKELLILIASCDCLAAEEYESLAAELLRLLYGQLSQLPEDFVLSEITQSNFIIWSLMSLTEVLKDAPSQKISKRLRFLENMVEKKFKMSVIELWALQEDGPQVVDVNEGT
eukprot:Blabericola_migrator_1__11434@NODE_679_length_6909_cov_149_679480_g493_i0_p4_GENE_NODE_679_length_6909_cov_149_679480_g493_i0NODE_679_length_6909_cov_149_679480_g493_i0_p4_ORF_typecomplete_len385_score61_56AAR2/PF05282_11/5_2e47LRR_RI_capping/PF18779_1/0_1DUF4283/PF14111_6/0_23_NODE_679_length_6909_cov_149_679480_g493_i056816835